MDFEILTMVVPTRPRSPKAEVTQGGLKREYLKYLWALVGFEPTTFFYKM
jgi:hypothetical protein